MFLEINDLSVKIENKNILKNLNLNINKGEVHAIMGPNGSGKTCLLQMFTGDNSHCYTNDLTMFGIKRGTGESIWDIKKHIGIMSNALHMQYKVNASVEHVIISGFHDSIGLYTRPTLAERMVAEQWLEVLGLKQKKNTPFQSLSFGDQRLVLIARSMVKPPAVLILDEPTAGVDVELRSNLWKNVKSLNKQGVTIILTTHYLLEAEEMCDRIGILNKGNLVALDSTKNLLKRIQTKIVTFVVNGKVNIENQSLKSLNVIDNQPGQLIVSYEKSLLNIGELINYINKQNIKISDISTDDGNLEDVFVRLTKN